MPNKRVPAPRTITSSGDQKTTISRRTARRARGEVVARRQGRRQQHHAFDGLFIQQFEGLDRDSRAARFGDQEDRVTRLAGLVTRGSLSAISRAFASRLATLVRSACQRPKPCPHGKIWIAYGSRSRLQHVTQGEPAPVQPADAADDHHQPARAVTVRDPVAELAVDGVP